MKVLFAQYTNPAGYPPIEHAATLVREAGHEIRVMGTSIRSVDELRFPPELEAKTERISRSSRGFLGKLEYARFVASVRTAIRIWRPDWVYLSDWLAAPLALGLGADVRTIYHEHDAPFISGSSFWQTILNRTRLGIAKRANVLIAPNDQRLELLVKESKRPNDRESFVVWNCPLSREATGARRRDERVVRLYFHGSITPVRLPLTLLRCLPTFGDTVALTIVGYDPSGRYIDEIRKEVARLGLQSQVTIRGVVETRADALHMAAGHDIGVCFYDRDELNHRTMVGASNKVFDYLAQGLLLLVTDAEHWRTLLEETGLAAFCNEHDVGSTVSAIRSAVDRVRAGEDRSVGPRLIRDRWNYDTQFAPILTAMAHPDACTGHT